MAKKVSSRYINIFVIVYHCSAAMMTKMSQVLRLWYPFATTFVCTIFYGKFILPWSLEYISSCLFGWNFQFSCLFWFYTCSLSCKFKHDAKFCRINDAILKSRDQGFPLTSWPKFPRTIPIWIRWRVCWEEQGEIDLLISRIWGTLLQKFGELMKHDLVTND